MADNSVPATGLKTKENIRAYIHVFHGKDIDRYRKDFLAGLEPDESPYGFHLADNCAFSTEFSRDYDGGLKIIQRALVRVFGFDVFHAFFNRDRVRSADVVWTMTEGEAFAVAALMALGIVPRRPILGNIVWLANNWKANSRFRRTVYTYLSRYISVMTVHSASCLPIVEAAFPRMRSQLFYFGVNTAVFPVSSPVIEKHEGPIIIFAAGNDPTRDWETLLAAFGNDPRFRLVMICWWLSDDRASRYDNLTLIRSPAMADFLQCYREADVVAVPMVANMYSGITVALEAVALGKPVLATFTGGLPTYFGPDEILYVPEGDPEAMRKALCDTTPESRAAQAARAQERFVERDFSTEGMVAQYVAVTRQILGPNSEFR
ncbi:glycosyltransferase [Brevundimonas variabilis]|uniref:Glycosyltransferase involved in cell wall biosynthesis n=1 Tax=Brevundimonas variabilis TaxID=74312 RepID=A0A7W9CJ12_9CAUL|nr:glycosyltransferase [Brevundimonas variabilis]MBB5746298.1 glycosyltransferase involved in cell wall biosynthesis [Brevundimonas variabilis]